MNKDKVAAVIRAAALVFAVLAVPPVVFVITGMVEGMGSGGAVSAMLAQYGNARPNLLMVGVIGLIPLAVLGVVLWAFGRGGASQATRRLLYWGALLPLFAVLIWSNHEFWRVYLPGLSAPGFPHGLELFIGPVFFAPVGMAAGMLVAWLVGRNRG